MQFLSVHFLQIYVYIFKSTNIYISLLHILSKKYTFQNNTLVLCMSLYSSHRNVMMRLNLQLTMGSFSLTLFGLIGVAFGMNLTTAFEDVRTFAAKYSNFYFGGSFIV